MSVHQSLEKKPYRKYPDSPMPRVPPHWQRWVDLYRIAPTLKRIHQPTNLIDKRPPRPLGDYAFVQFAACYADPTKREALRALMFDLLKDDIADLIIAVLRRRNP